VWHEKSFGIAEGFRELALRAIPRLRLHKNQKKYNVCRMMNWMKLFLVATSTLAFSAEAAVSCEIDFSSYVGWTIVYSGKVTGYVDENGEKQDDFEGCDFDRVLIIDYTKSVTCAGYGYSYAYNPDIVIFSDGSSMEACINDNMYRIRK